MNRMEQECRKKHVKAVKMGQNATKAAVVAVIAYILSLFLGPLDIKMPAYAATTVMLLADLYAVIELIRATSLITTEEDSSEKRN